MASTGNQPVIPFLDMAEENAKTQKICDGFLSLERLFPKVKGKEGASYLPRVPNPFPLPAIDSYMFESTKRHRRRAFFRITLEFGPHCPFYVQVTEKKDSFYQLNILSTEFPMKVDDLNILAVIKADELILLEIGTIIKAVIAGVRCRERSLVMTIKSQNLKLGVIAYKDLPGHFRIEQELPRKSLYEHIEKCASSGVETCHKILEYLDIDPKKAYCLQSDSVKPEEMGENIMKEQKIMLSNHHLNEGLKLCCTRETVCVAENEFKMALSFNPTNASALSSLGSLYRSQKKYKKAFENFEAALASDSENENHKGLLIKTIKEYLDDKDSKEGDEKLFYSKRLYELQGINNKTHSIFKHIVKASLSLSSHAWFLDLDLEEWKKSKETVQKNQVDVNPVQRTESMVSVPKVPEQKKNTFTANPKSNLIRVPIHDPDKEKPKEIVNKSYGLLSENDSLSVEEISDSSTRHGDHRSRNGRESTKSYEQHRRKHHKHHSCHRKSHKSKGESTSSHHSYRSRHYSKDRDSSRSSRSRYYSRERSLSPPAKSCRLSRERSISSSRYYSQQKSRSSSDGSPSHSMESGCLSSHSDARVLDPYSPKGSSKDSSEFRNEKIHLPSTQKQKRKSQNSVSKDYYDFDIPEDPWEPQALFPCTSYPSFTKKPAVSIMNEIVDMIEEVRSEMK